MNDEHDTFEGDETPSAPGLWSGPASEVESDTRAFEDDAVGEALDWNRPDPYTRPHDPAGSFPRRQARELLPVSDEPLVLRTAPTFPKPLSLPRMDGPAPELDETAELPDPPHVARFQFITGALIALAAAGVLLFALVLSNGNDTKTQTIEIGPSWSEWAPAAGHGDGATQIANHVGREYKLDSGSQLVAVTGGPLEVAGLPLTIAVRTPAAQGGDIHLEQGKGVLYRLCGLGDKCSIPSGKPSVERHLLLRREALELALYSFRYLKDVNQVVVFLPPRKGQDPSQALFFTPHDVQAELTAPLDDTIASRTPRVQTMRTSPNASLIDRVTSQSLFQFSLTQANQDARAFLVLDPFSASP